MSALVVLDQHAADERHTELVVTLAEPAPLDVTDAEWRASLARALDVAGVLARICIDIEGALAATRADHRCGVGPLYRELPRPGEFEVVDAVTSTLDTCTAYLLDAGPSDHETLLDDGIWPSLCVCVPHNRVRGWTARLARAIQDITAWDARALAFTDTEVTANEPSRN